MTGGFLWKYGLASRTPTASARIVSTYTTAVNGLLTAALLAYIGFLVLIFGVLAPIAILLHQTGHLFAMLRRSDALQSISRPLKLVSRPKPHGLNIRGSG